MQQQLQMRHGERPDKRGERAQDRAKGIEALMRHYHSGDYFVNDRCMDKTVVLKLEVESLSCKVNKRD